LVLSRVRLIRVRLVLVNLNPINDTYICEKCETGRKMHFSVQAKSSHFFPFKKVLYRRCQNVTFFGKDVTKNVTS